MSTEWQPLPALPDLRRVGIIALDTETKDGGLLADRGSGWPWADGHICGVSVAYRAEGTIRSHYFSLRHPDSQNFDPEQVFQWLRDHAPFCHAKRIVRLGLAARRRQHGDASL